MNIYKAKKISDEQSGNRFIFIGLLYVEKDRVKEIFMVGVKNLDLISVDIFRG
jgi:hypothetical protein